MPLISVLRFSYRKCDQCEDKQSSLYCQECESEYCVGCNAVFHAKIMERIFCNIELIGVSEYCILKTKVQIRRFSRSAVRSFFQFCNMHVYCISYCTEFLCVVTFSVKDERTPGERS